MVGGARPQLFLSAVIIVLLAACSATPIAPEATQPVQAVDTDIIAATVVAQVEAKLPRPVPTPDLAALQAAILAAVEEQVPATDSQALTRLVDEVVAARLAEGDPIVPIARQGATAALATTDLEGRLVEVYENANPAVVYVIVPPLGSGSGFVYDNRGYIVTNHHVVDGSRSFEIVFASGDRTSASLVGADADSDLAVLKVDGLPAGVQPLVLAEPDSLRVGQFVVAIGNPFGEQGSMSLGIVSGLDRSLRSQRGQGASTSYSLPEVIQTDAPINPGNSGGPLLNLAGEVVGVNSAIASETGVNSGVGFSIPVMAVLQVVPTLIEDGQYSYGYMGAAFDDEITLSDQSQFRLAQTQGAYVIGVTPGGPAARAGLVGADPNTGRGGDLIVEIDGVPIRDFSDLNSYLVFNARAGQTIQVTVLRGTNRVTLPVTLGTRP